MTYYRVADPTPLAGVRPGAAAATVASCLALGGGATYCVERGIDPTRVSPERPSAKARTRRHATAVAGALRRRRPHGDIHTAGNAAADSDGAGDTTADRDGSPPPPRAAAPQDEYEPVSPRSEASAAGVIDAESRRRRPPTDRGSSTDRDRDGPTGGTDAPSTDRTHCAFAERALRPARCHPADRPSPGEFSVATCQADSLTFSTHAFVDFATRGMSIKRACNPEGPGLRGLITANVFAAPVRAARSRWSRSAPPRDPLHDVPVGGNGAPARLPLRAAALRRCARRQADPDQERTRQPALPAQEHAHRPPATGRARTTSAARRESSSASSASAATAASRARRAARTTSAPTRPRSASPTACRPAAAIVPDTPLARGAWVSGTQPLNYDATDNVGVRLAQASSPDRPAGLSSAHARSPRRTARSQSVPCPNGPGQITVNTQELSGGHAAAHRSGARRGWQRRQLAPVTARIDNTAPGRVDVRPRRRRAVAQHERLRRQLGATRRRAIERRSRRASYKLCPRRAGAARSASRPAQTSRGFGVQVPAPGEWTAVALAPRRRRAMQSETAASVPVTLRYDPEPPRLAFEPPSASTRRWSRCT